MCPGGSDTPNRIVHVKFIVLPLSTYKSGPPKIVATGSVCAFVFTKYSTRHEQNKQREKKKMNKYLLVFD